MEKKFIIVPVDGATNIKLEVLDFENLQTIESFSTSTPKETRNNIDYNLAFDEFEWFESSIKKLGSKIKNNTVIISPVARGASGAFINSQNNIIDSEDHRKTIAYTQKYPADIERRFLELIDDKDKFFSETGSVADFPGGLTLIKRFIYESMMRPEKLEEAKGFATYNLLISGYFSGRNFLDVIKKAGNEHTYWLCHTGARNIKKTPGTPSSLALKIPQFFEYIPKEPVVPYIPLGKINKEIANHLNLSEKTLIMPGGHDTALSHIPIISSFCQAFPEYKGKALIHLDSGTWTMSAKIGGKLNIPSDGYKKSIMIQGTVDGSPVVTGLYGGGNDFQHVKKAVEKKGKQFFCAFDVNKLESVLNAQECFVVPNISPINKGTGPEPNITGKIINEEKFYNLGSGQQHIITCIATALMSSRHIEIIDNENAPIILTAGGAKDPYLAKFIATLTGRKVFIVKDSHGNILSETTTLGAGILGKAGYLNIHPYNVNLNNLNIKYELVEPLDNNLSKKLLSYVKILWKHIENPL